MRDATKFDPGVIASKCFNAGLSGRYGFFMALNLGTLFFSK